MALLGAIAAANCAADIYKWTDANGHVQYGDHPPEDKSAKPLPAILAAGTSSTSPDIEVEDTVMQYYEVRGATAQDLQRAIGTFGPVSQQDKTRRYAHCSWRLTWNYTFKTERGQCVVDKLKVKVSAVITFPKWSNPEAGNAELREKWNQMSRALRKHEDGHKENGVRVANDIARHFRGMPPEPECAVLGQKLNALGNRTIEESRALDAAYDRATNHGVNDGATLR
jgi:predicted secreted Zn-dependent protease